MPTNSKTLPLQDRNLIDEIISAARYAAVHDEVLREYASQNPAYKSNMEWLERNGLDPTAWLDVVSVPAAFAVDSQSTNDALLSQVFRDCELDPRRPRHWRLLVNVLVEHCFRGPGRSEKWDEAGLFDLLCDVRAVQKKLAKHTTKRDLAAALKKRFREKYKNMNPDTLRKQIARAIDPAINPNAVLQGNDDLISARAHRAAKELGLQSQLGMEMQLATLRLLRVDDIRTRLSSELRKSGEELTDEIWDRDYAAAAKELARLELEQERAGSQKPK